MPKNGRRSFKLSLILKEDYMAEKNLVYRYNDKIKGEEEAEANFHGCINKIIIEPVVEINADIRGLITSVTVVEIDEKMSDKNLKHDDNGKNELEENCHVNEGVNCIVIKPIIKVDIDISELYSARRDELSPSTVYTGYRKAKENGSG